MPARCGFAHDLTGEPGLAEISLYLQAIEHAVNAVASLSGSPLTERRFLLRFPARAQAIGRPGLYPGLLGLLGGPSVDGQTLSAWLPAWQSAYQAIPAVQAPPRLHPVRRAYYQRAFEKILSGNQPQDVLWPMLRTWTHMMQLLPESGIQHQEWSESFQRLGLLGEGFAQRVEALDAYLDTVEEILDDWARAAGIE
jgi:hypothetical protein